MRTYFLLPVFLLSLLAVSCGPENSSKSVVRYSPSVDSLLRDTVRMTVLGDSIRRQLLSTSSDSIAISGLSRLTEFYFNRQATSLADNALALSAQPGNESSSPAAWCAKGIAAHRSQQYDTAFYFLRKSMELAGKYGDSYTRLRAAVWTGDCLRMTYRIREAQRELDSCAAAAGPGQEQLRAQALSLAGDVYRFDNKDSIAYLRYDKALEVAMAAGDSARVAFVLAGKAQLLRKTGESEKAFNALQRGLVAAKSVNDLTRAAFILSTQGDEYRFRGKNAEALACYNEAVDYARRLNEKRRLGILCNVMTQVYWSQGDYEKALQVNQQAMDVLAQVNDPSALAFALGNRGEVYRMQKKLDSALFYYRRSQAISASLDDRQRLGYNYAAIADIFSEMKNYDSTLANAEQAFAIGEETGDKNISSDALRIKAMTAVNLGHFAEAKKLGEQSLEEAKAANNSSTLSAGYEVLHVAYRGLGMTKEALDAYEKFITMNDSVKGSEQIRKLAGVEYQAREARLKAEQARREAKIEAEKKIQEHQIGQQRMVILAGIAGAFLLLVLLAVAYNAYRGKKRANELIAQQKSEVEHQKAIVEEQNREITDSINYAQRIQQAILPPEEELRRHFTDLFILFRPRNIVSGDFYWFGESNENKVIALADCTGHGVPGGFMSMLGFEILQDMILREEIRSTSDALSRLDEKLTSTLNKNSRSYRDGMDMALCAFRQGTNLLQYSGANRPLVHIAADGALTVYKPDKHPIGGGIDGTEKVFTHTEIRVNPGDMIYLFSDGYPDQFGGAKGKKFMLRKFEELLLSVHHLPLQEQKQVLHDTFEEWRGNLGQVDDVCVIGLRI